MVRSQNWPRLFVDIFSLKLPCIRYQKTQIPIFEDFLKNKNLTKICFKMVSYKVYHRMNWSSVTQGLFWDQESRINSVRTMKKKAKTIDRSIQNGAISMCFFAKWQLCFELPFKLVNLAPFLDSTTYLKVLATVWTFSLIVRCRTHRKKRPLPRKIPKNITKAGRPPYSVAITEFSCR